VNTRRHNTPIEKDGELVPGGWNRRAFLGLIARGAVGMALSPLVARAQSDDAAPPNFVIIFTDDQGYDDVGCYWTPKGAPGYEKIDTPALDTMAQEGVKFTDFYACAPVCTPSRAGLMTGCYADRVGLGKVLGPKSTKGLNPDEVTIAELLKRRGYATACIGKWHLGHHSQFLPTRHGFDYFFGLPYSNDMVPAILMRNEEVIFNENTLPRNQMTQMSTEEAVNFISANKDRPFFLYLAHAMPHVPLWVSEAFRHKSRRGLYGDVIMEIDWSVGKVLEKLKALGLKQNTLVIFTSDNGPWLKYKVEGGKAYPLRYGKATVFEGGQRVPCIMRWPGKIPAGSVCHELAAAMDVYPTLALLAGASLPRGRVIDGKDIWPLMSGAPDATSPHEALFYIIDNQVLGVRKGQWKYILKHRPISWAFPPRQAPGEVSEALYDLSNDISEAVNVIDAHPTVVQELKELRSAFIADLAKNSRPASVVEK